MYIDTAPHLSVVHHENNIEGKIGWGQAISRPDLKQHPSSITAY
jgi:hypothetical protein